MSTKDVGLHGEIMNEAIGLLGRYQAYRNAPDVCRDMHKIVKCKTGVADPYREVKQKDLQLALSLLPKLQKLIDGKQDRLYWALKIAATGNVLDFAVNTGANIEESMDRELQKAFAICDAPMLEQQLKTAKSILVIGDNTGETVFDCILLAQFPHLERTYAVRSAPIINDATIEDAKASGLHQYANIISTGCDVPGVILEEGTKEFLDIFNHADIVICKGQGNYETLNDCGREIYFLLKAKCPVLADLLNVSINDYVFKHVAKSAKAEAK
jgi:uncharacterized protein with ATP-grasp and redox domains